MFISCSIPFVYLLKPFLKSIVVLIIRGTTIANPSSLATQVRVCRQALVEFVHGFDRRRTRELHPRTGLVSFSWVSFAFVARGTRTRTTNAQRRFFLPCFTFLLFTKPPINFFAKGNLVASRTFNGGLLLLLRANRRLFHGLRTSSTIDAVGLLAMFCFRTLGFTKPFGDIFVAFCHIVACSTLNPCFFGNLLRWPTVFLFLVPPRRPQCILWLAPCLLLLLWWWWWWLLLLAWLKRSREIHFGGYFYHRLHERPLSRWRCCCCKRS